MASRPRRGRSRNQTSGSSAHQWSGLDFAGVSNQCIITFRTFVLRKPENRLAPSSVRVVANQSLTLETQPRPSVILSEAKNLHWFASNRNCRSFAEFTLSEANGLRMTGTFISVGGPQVHLHSQR